MTITAYSPSMTDKHLFCFVFETPNQYRHNAERGFDDEDSAALWIVAATPADALQWGQTVAQAYVDWLFSRAQAEGYSWRDAGFANWIEADQNSLSPASLMQSPPVVSVGDMPEFGCLAG